MTTFNVSNLNDNGIGSFRAALLAANADTSGAPIIIKFSITGSIQLLSDLPSITKAVQIDGTSAPGYSSAGHPVVEIDFAKHAGITFSAGASGSSFIGLAVGNASGNGITLNASNITINKNYVGLHADGSAFGNTGDGVFISSVSSNNKIGDNPTAASGFIGNVISGNTGNGVSLHGSTGNILVDNHIGTNVAGTASIANGLNGILLTDGASGNTIGGTAFVDTSTGAVNNPTGNKGTQPATFVVPPLGNLVSGNVGNGILVTNNSQNNVLNGNFVGTSADGNSAIGNGLNGVFVLNAPNNSLIGCEFINNPFVYYNVLSGNGANGLRISNSDNVTVQANFFGVGANNASVVANGQNGILVDGTSQNVQVGGVIPLGNVSAGNKLNGIYVTDKVSGFTTFNTFGGLYAFQGAAPNGNDGILIDSTGGNNLIRTNVFSGNINNGIEIAGNASGITVDPNISGLNTIGNGLLPNGKNGLLITDTAHGNIVGGFLNSVIPQNTFSGNVGYGVVISGAAYDNKIINSAVGMDVLRTAALANQSGGILVATTGTNNLIGGVTTNPSQPQSNYIGGNSGSGVVFTVDSSGNQLINNFIGVDRFGVANLPNSGQPIALNGAYANNIYGNTPTPQATYLGLPPQEFIQQIESLYIGYYGRAGDDKGINYWSNQTLKALQTGSTLFQAMNNVSAAMATSAENGPYAALAYVPLNPNDPAQIALATSFIKQVYQQSFNRAADPSGVAYWLDALFSGRVAFTSLVNVINNSAQLTDLTNLENKMLAASYFGELAQQSSITPKPAALVDAVKAVTDETSLLASKAASNLYFGTSANQATYASAFQTNAITGVRGEYNGNVVLTGSSFSTTGGTSTVTASLYYGPMQDSALGYNYALTPQFPNQSIKSSTFYGPNTSVFDPSIGVGNVIAVGSYVLNSSSDPRNHGMIYQGVVSGGGSWTQIDVPSTIAGGNLLDTIPHSVMGNIVVGNYDLVGVPASGNAFIYNKASDTWTIMDQAFGGTQQFTTLYGVWQNGIRSTSYTIVGGSNHGGPIQQAFLADYDSATGQLSHITYFPAFNNPFAFSHFEGITAVPGGYNLVATTPNGPAYVTVTRNVDGTFNPSAQWTSTNVAAAATTTGNSIYQNFGMGVYILPGSQAADVVSTYTALVDQSSVDPFGGLIMKIGSLSYSYATTIPGSIGALIVGSTTAGNILGGSIGNDIFVGVKITDKSDTIFTGGGADLIQLSDGRTTSTHIELYASNQINSTQSFVPGTTMPALTGSVVTASDIPQLGWWGQATGQVGGPASNTTTNLGYGNGTSADITIVSKFNAGSLVNNGDAIDLSLSAYSNLLRSVKPDSSPAIGNAVLSNPVSPGGTISVANADVIVLSNLKQYANAADVAKTLTTASTSINFSSPQTNSINHYILAYEDTMGNTRFADLDIHSATAFSNTANVTTLAVSDLVQLAGVNLTQIHSSNIQFVA